MGYDITRGQTRLFTVQKSMGYDILDETNIKRTRFREIVSGGCCVGPWDLFRVASRASPRDTLYTVTKL